MNILRVLLQNPNTRIASYFDKSMMFSNDFGLFTNVLDKYSSPLNNRDALSKIVLLHKHHFVYSGKSSINTGGYRFVSRKGYVEGDTPFRLYKCTECYLEAGVLRHHSNYSIDTVIMVFYGMEYEQCIPYDES